MLQAASGMAVAVSTCTRQSAACRCTLKCGQQACRSADSKCARVRTASVPWNRRTQSAANPFAGRQHRSPCLRLLLVLAAHISAAASVHLLNLLWLWAWGAGHPRAMTDQCAYLQKAAAAPQGTAALCQAPSRGKVSSSKSRHGFVCPPPLMLLQANKRIPLGSGSQHTFMSTSRFVSDAGYCTCQQPAHQQLKTQQPFASDLHVDVALRQAQLRGALVGHAGALHVVSSELQREMQPAKRVCVAAAGAG